MSKKKNALWRSITHVANSVANILTEMDVRNAVGYNIYNHSIQLAEAATGEKALVNIEGALSFVDAYRIKHLNDGRAEAIARLWCSKLKEIYIRNGNTTRFMYVEEQKLSSVYNYARIFFGRSGIYLFEKIGMLGAARNKLEAVWLVETPTLYPLDDAPQIDMLTPTTIFGYDNILQLGLVLSASVLKNQLRIDFYHAFRYKNLPNGNHIAVTGYATLVKRDPLCGHHMTLQPEVIDYNPTQNEFFYRLQQKPIDHRHQHNYCLMRSLMVDGQWTNKDGFMQYVDQYWRG